MKNTKWISGSLLGVLIAAAAPAPAYAKPPLAKRTSEQAAVKQELLLISGLQSTLDLSFLPCNDPPKECIKVANAGLMTVQYSADKKQLIFTPLKRGETTVTVRDEKGDIRLIMKAIVSENNLSRRLQELKDLLRDIEGIEMRIMGERIVIDGEVVVLSDLNRYYHVISDPMYSGLVMNLVSVSPVGMQIMADQIQAQINKQSVKVRPFNGLFLIEGQVENQTEADTVITIARSMLQGFVLNRYDPKEVSTPIELRASKPKDPIVTRLTFAPQKPKPGEKMFRITVDFVELSKDYIRNFGFSWIPSLDTGGSIQFGQSTTGGVTSQGSGSLSGTIGNLFPKLSSAQNAGYARILEESVIMVKSGVEGSLVRKLQVPVQSTNAQGQPVFNTQSVGPELFVTPKLVGQSEDIDLKVRFGYDGFAGKAPSGSILVLTHKFSSEVIVKSGESAALVNALSNVISTQFNKDPPGGTQPANPLFTLLRSKAFQKNKSQFVVFLTPQIISSTSEGTEDIKHKYGMKRK